MWYHTIYIQRTDMYEEKVDKCAINEKLDLRNLNIILILKNGNEKNSI